LALFLWQKLKTTIFINTDDHRVEKNRRLTGGFFMPNYLFYVIFSIVLRSRCTT